MIFRVLGQLEICADGRAPGSSPPQRRAVLAALIVDAGQPVPVQTLLCRVWDESPPVAARAALHAHITRIRRALARPDGPPLARLRHSGSGYLLEVARAEVDLHRFRHLLARAKDQRSDRDRVVTLHAALGLWRGTPLADVPGEWAARAR